MSIYYRIKGEDSIYEAKTVQAISRLYVRYGTSNIKIMSYGG
jgi:hypothetical protein